MPFLNQNVWTDSEGDVTIDEEAWRMALGLSAQPGGKDPKYITRSDTMPSIGVEQGDVFYTSNLFDWDKAMNKWNNLLKLSESGDWNIDQNIITDEYNRLYDIYDKLNEAGLSESEEGRDAYERWSQIFDIDDYQQITDREGNVIPNSYKFIGTGHNYITDEDGHNAYDPWANVTMSMGEDDHGRYISYYDKYDFDSDITKQFITPLNFYDKRYIMQDKEGNWVINPEQPESKAKGKYGGSLPKAQTGFFDKIKTGISNFIGTGPKLSGNDSSLTQEIVEKEMGVGKYDNREDPSINKFMPNWSKEMIFNKFRPGRYPIMSEVWKDLIGKKSQSYPNTKIGITNKEPWVDSEGDYTVDEEAWRMVLGLDPQESGENKYILPSDYLPSGDEYNPDLDYYKLAPGQMDWQAMLNSVNRRNAELIMAEKTGDYGAFYEELGVGDQAWEDEDFELTQEQIASLKRYTPGSSNIAIPSYQAADIGGVEHMYNYLIDPHQGSGPGKSGRTIYDPIARFDMDISTDEEGKHYISYRDVYNFNSPLMNAAIQPFGWYDRQYVDYDEATGFFSLPEGTDLTGMSENIYNYSQEDLDKMFKENGGELPKAQNGTGNLMTVLFNNPFSVREELKRNFVENIMPFDYNDPNMEDGEWYNRLINTALDDNIEDKRLALDEVLKANPNIEKGLYPMYRERLDLLNMMMGFDQPYSEIKQSNYRPTQGARENTIFYSSDYTENEISNRLSKILEWSKNHDGDISGFARDFYDRDGDESRGPDKAKMIPCKKGEVGCVKTKEGWFYDDYMMPNPDYLKGMYGKVLGNFKLDMGKDDHGHYISYYDQWNLNPIQNNEVIGGLINTLGGMKPPQVYGRIYYNPETGKKIKGPKKKLGGEFLRKVQRLNQQLQLFNSGGKISPLAKKELEKLNLIKPEMQTGGEPVVQNSYVVKKGDNLTRIARANNMTLSEILALNPKYINDPSTIYSGDRIALSENTGIDNSTATFTYEIKSGDTLSKIANKHGVRYEDIAKLNNISDPGKIYSGQKIILPDNINTNDPNIKRNQDIIESPYTDVAEMNVDDNHGINSSWNRRIPPHKSESGQWENSGKRTIKTQINKMDQASRIVKGMNEIEGDNSKTINYTIKSGDNLTTIANKNGVTLDKLVADNNIDDPSKIQIGQNIKINKSAGKPYIVVDEKKGRMHLYYPGNDKPVKSYPILTGENVGDAQTVTKGSFYYNGKKLDRDGLNDAMRKHDASSIDDLMEVPGYTSDTDWGKGNKQTGAGVYTIGMINEDSGFYDDSGQGRPTPSFVLNNAYDDEVPMVIHTVPSSKSADRINSLNDNDQTNNRMTNGCINGTCTALTELYENPDVGEGTKVFVLPEDAGNNFVYENGEINFYASRDNQKEYKTYIDAYGNEQEGHGIANKITNTYKPISITFDKNYYQTKSERYDGTASGEEEEFVNNTQPFLNSLTDNKKFMMDKLGMDGDMYNDLALIAFGIYGYESGMGDEGSAAENLLKAGTKYLDLRDTSPDVRSKYDTYGLTGEDRSVGWTQIRWNERDPTEIEALKKVGITSNDQLMDPANSAKATVAILYKEYQNQISSSQKRDPNFDIYTELPKKYSPTGGDDYANMVNKYIDYIDLQETDIDDVDNNVIVKGEYSDLNPESNKRMKEKGFDEKILNLGETIEHGYNQNIAPVIDEASDWISEKKDQVSNWWDGVDLNPFSKLGGEFGMRNQVQFYNDYISGVYKGTKQENKANKLYDKLNRIYYNDSKRSGLHQLDVMKSILRSNR